MTAEFLDIDEFEFLLRSLTEEREDLEDKAFKLLSCYLRERLAETNARRVDDPNAPQVGYSLPEPVFFRVQPWAYDMATTAKGCAVPAAGYVVPKTTGGLF